MTGWRARAGALLGVLGGLLAAGAITAPAGQAQALGPSLAALTANNASVTCADQAPVAPDGNLLHPQLPSSCTIFSLSLSNQVPEGRYVITQAAVKTGPEVGEMELTVIEGFNSLGGSGPLPGGAGGCCTVVAVSQPFTPQPNTTTTITGLNLPAQDTFNTQAGLWFVDYLGITVLDRTTPLPIDIGPNGGCESLSWSTPPSANTANVDGTICQSASLLTSPTGVVQDLIGTPLVSAQLQPATTTTPPVAPPITPPVTPPATQPTQPAAPAAPPANNFTIRPRVQMLGGGTRARLGIDLPGPGTLRVGSRARAAAAAVSTASATAVGRNHGRRKHAKRRTLIVPFTHTYRAGKVKPVIKLTSAGKARLRKRRKLRIRVEITFTPTGGSSASKTKMITFRVSRRKHGRRHGH